MIIPSRPSVVKWEHSADAGDPGQSPDSLSATPPKRTGGDVNVYDFRALVTELRSMRVFNVNLSGGEAMLHRRIVDMVGLVYSLGMKVTMSTNCTLADLAKVTALREAGLRQVHISLDSHDPVQHDLMRGHEGSFRRMTSNLGHLRAVGIEYTLVTTLRGQTVADYEATIDKAFELGASAHKTNTLVPQGRGHVLEMPSFDLTRDYIAAFRRKQAEYAGRFRLLAETMFHLQMSTSGGPGVPQVLDVGCPAGIMTCAVNERGDVMPCSFFTELTAGNAVKEGFRTIWEDSPLLSELRRRQADDTCRQCAHSPTCGGCRARSYGIHGELHRDDPYCSTASGAMPERRERAQSITLLSGRPEFS